MERLHSLRITSVQPRLRAIGLVCGMALALLLPALACGSGGDARVGETSTAARSAEAARSQAVTVTVQRPLVSADLPLLAESPDGWVLTIEEIELLDLIDTPSERYRPENGIFLVLLGTIENRTDEDACLYGNDIDLVGGNQRHSMDSALLDALKYKYSRDYPGFFRGQCLDYDATEPTFMVFDVPDSVLLSLSLDGANQVLGILNVDEMAIVEVTVTPTASSTIATTPSPQTTPTPEPAPLASAVVVRGANLRAGPGTGFEIVGTAFQGEELRVIGRSDDSAWLMVESEEPAWIWLDLVELSTDVTDVSAATTRTTSAADSEVSSTASPIPSPSPLPSSTPSSMDLIDAWLFCEFAVEYSLKAPRTAKFPWTDTRRVEDLGDYRFRIDSYVDAENSFGAMLRNYFTCSVMRDDEGNWHLESLQFK